MQKTFLKFVVFELVEKIAHFQLLLDECADSLHERAPELHETLCQASRGLENRLIEQKGLLNKLFNEQVGSDQERQEIYALIREIYTGLRDWSQILLQFRHLDIEPETFLFLKDALPADLTQDAGEQTVFLSAEGQQHSIPQPLTSRVLIDHLSILDKNNPLAWVDLTQAYAAHLLTSASTLTQWKQDVLKADSKKKQSVLSPALLDDIALHAISLHLLGPAYYFQALSNAVFAQNDRFLHAVEPVLFYGLNHQNFNHKSMVLLHEACERAHKSDLSDAHATLEEEAMASLFRAIEKRISGKGAFQEKHLERAIQLQERISQGVLLSSTPLYPVDEVESTLTNTREDADFSIYAPLSMLTEYPHTPREIVNAGWLHKIERSPAWLYSVLNESREEGLARILTLIDYQDHLLRKSIEVSEVHRVLLCT